MPEPYTAEPYTELDRLCIDTIRTLAIDAVQAANSGHPGAPLSLAPAAYVLFARVMRHNPADPAWPDRDRFVLSAGHASMLLYASLHLAGYDLSLDEIKRFRQLGSLTPGHPEFRHTAGVETTTGPLGQGFANGVGMAMAERFLRERYGADVVDHRVFAICSDGDLMEGISSEAASIAGHLGLGRIVYLYDDNRITIDGSTDLSFSENVSQRFAAQGWHTLEVADGEDVGAIEAAVRAGVTEEERPTLIRLRTVIAHHSPGKRGTSKAHGEALGVDEVAATKRALGWDPEGRFFIPDGVRAHFDQGRGAQEQARWQSRFDAWAAANPQLAAEWRDGQAGKVGNGFTRALPVFDPAETPKLATRAASGKVFDAMSPYVPTMIGGAADLVGSTKTIFPGDDSYTRARAGRNVHWGIREHAMAAAVNGLALHGGIVKPYGSTFFVFTDYMRPSIRLSALMELDVVWVLTHDSVAVGEDGPTHQPIEHLAALRAIPGLTVLRPADANETVEAWRVVLEEVSGPALLVLTRQDLPVLDRTTLAGAEGVARGAYVLADAETPDAVLVATGSEVSVALGARELLAEQGRSVRVVSMPSWELFAAQAASYREQVLPAGVPKLSVEAASTFGWSRWVDRSIGIDSFGASGPAADVLAHFGITPDAVAERVEAALAEVAQLS